MAVAPHVGAWIETGGMLPLRQYTKSLPMWERGLKHDPRVAEVVLGGSLPMWERGLKLCREGVQRRQAKSLPMWERGLKP